MKEGKANVWLNKKDHVMNYDYNRAQTLITPAINMQLNTAPETQMSQNEL